MAEFGPFGVGARGRVWVCEGDYVGHVVVTLLLRAGGGVVRGIVEGDGGFVLEVLWRDGVSQTGRVRFAPGHGEADIGVEILDD